jgi:biotin synthase
VPGARIRLAAGRHAMSDEMQTLAFLCGANSIFTGEKLLTAPGIGTGADQLLLARLGMHLEGASR